MLHRSEYMEYSVHNNENILEMIQIQIYHNRKAFSIIIFAQIYFRCVTHLSLLDEAVCYTMEVVLLIKNSWK